MKYFYLPLIIVYLPLMGMYIYQRGNRKYADFRWGVKNRIGVWFAILLALIILTAKLFFPFFVNSINIDWNDYRGRSGGEIYLFIQWLIALTLLIFPHIIKRDNWSNNPTPSQFHDRFNAHLYWYAGLIFSILPISNTLTLLN
ncbi:hypothetical protein [Catenovulum maritimum]|uniref:Uncharacterized protein n=1 Tax=Catenovulum maritimum TaxID=1513271 RepID=A0A0J8H210_9ALTE|nr:hypothetical protein [Catenovulum maritimum]KMT67058.1 hypothetical protein XM47_00225 [Catenovulum maritimum]